MSKIDLTVVVTAHNEGLVVHKTMLSVFEGMKKVEKAGYSCEILVHIDNGDEITKRYFKRYDKLDGVSVYRNSFDDAGSSKNYLVQRAKGVYVAILEAGDLISSNFFLEAIKLLEGAKESSIVHAEALLEFGIDQPYILSMQDDLLNFEEGVFRLISGDQWGPGIMATKKTLLRCPYLKSEIGYGKHNYVFNILAFQQNIKHRIAHNTMYFWRKNGLVNDFSNEAIPGIELFNPLKVQRMRLPEFDNMDDPRIFENKINGGVRIKALFCSLLRKTRDVLRRKLSFDETDTMTNSIVEKFVIDNWEQMNQIETQLYPHPWILEELSLNKNDSIDIGYIYYKIIQGVTRKPDYVFIVPWLTRGGGDKATLNYIEALKKINPSWHFVVIATEPNTQSIWANKLSKSADFIEFGKHCQGVNNVDRDTLMTLLITQLGCKKIHIINSEYGYIWARRHMDLLRCYYQLNVSLFAAEFFPGTDGKCTFSYEDPYLSEIIFATNKVCTDNETMIKRMLTREGFEDDGRFKIHYQPVTINRKMLPKLKFVEDGKLHIMWAGRIVPVKMPEMIVEIGKRLEPDKYVIDVYGEIGSGIDENIFDGVDNIRYYGGFDNFESLPINKADVFLYTSMSDGMPNTILEATSAGLPVIASDDGGVGEFIQDGKTGLLVEDMLNPDAYVEKIKSIGDIKVLGKYVENAQKLLETRHSWGAFLKNVRRDLVDGKNK